MSTKKLNIDLDLRKKACETPFAMKQQAAGVFIEGYANRSTIDRGDEMIANDAWELDNFKRNPVILFNHGMDTLGGTPVGKAIEIAPTEEGLKLKVKMSNSQSPGIKMVRELVEERILKAFSVGFNPKESVDVEVDGKSIRQINQAELFEVSIVGVPMNQDSLFELSEKALATKSLHQLKGEILKAKGAETALGIEEKLGNCSSRREAIQFVSKIKGVELDELLDMLAGDGEISEDVAEAFELAVKAVDLKEVLQEAMSSIEEGETEAMVVESLLAKLKPQDEEEEDDEEGKKATDGEEDEDEGKEDEEEEGKEKGADGEGTAAEAEGSGDAKAGESDEEEPKEDDESKRKKDFQECVNSKIPKLIEEGREQDEAVAMAISMCQEEGKCCLVPEAKQDAFASAFTWVENGMDGDIEWSETLTLVGAEEDKSSEEGEQKAVDEEAQSEQPPTTPIKTEDNPDNFGSPFLEAAKQTNVLLGALINEIQKLSSKMDGIMDQNSLSSNSSSSEAQVSEEPADEKTVDYASKKLEDLGARLNKLGY